VGGRQPGGQPGAKVEAGPGQPVLDRVVVDLARGQWHLGVGAHVTYRIDLALGAGHRDRLARHLDTDDALGRKLGQGADPDVHRGIGFRHPRTPDGRDFVSSASMASVIRSRSSGTSMVPISWPKKPRLTSLPASSNGIPRAIR